MTYTKNAENFRCECCDFYTSKKSNYLKHISTRKHKRLTQWLEKKPENKQKNTEIKSHDNTSEEQTPKLYSCGCGKAYKHRQSLYTHRKKCTFLENPENMKISESTENSKNTESESKNTESELQKELKNTNKKLELCMDIIQNQVIPNMQQAAITNINNTTNNTTNNNTTNNNTNNFNLNIFLNETCKDAINMTEFIENLKVGLRELEFVKDNGIVKGISNVFVNELNALDVDKRPIHCTDAKRKTLYIKDDDKWDKENKATNEKIDRSIQHVKKKHIDSIKEWEEQHPNWCDDEKLAMEYLRMARNSTTPIDKTGEKKIISDVAAEVDITDIKNKV